MDSPVVYWLKIAGAVIVVIGAIIALVVYVFDQKDKRQKEIAKTEPDVHLIDQTTDKTRAITKAERNKEIITDPYFTDVDGGFKRCHTYVALGVNKH